MKMFLQFAGCCAMCAAIALAPVVAAEPARFTTSIKQITFGPQHHFFGYIGHVQTIPWNKSGRQIVALRTVFQERMPKPGEASTAGKHLAEHPRNQLISLSAASRWFSQSDRRAGHHRGRP